jgi:hypothetical protein
MEPAPPDAGTGIGESAGRTTVQSTSYRMQAGVSRIVASVIDRDQKPEFLIGNVPCPGNHCVGGQRFVPLSAARSFCRAGIARRCT